MTINKPTLLTIFKKIQRLLCILVVTIFFGSQAIYGQNSLNSSDSARKWQYKVEPYLMFPNMSGNTGVAELPLVEIDAKYNDIFDRLKFGAMLYFEAGNGNWSINSDILYMHLQQGVKAGRIVTGGTADAKQMGWELAGLKTVLPWLEFGVGGLLNAMEMDLTLTLNQPGEGSGEQSGSQNKTWFDPMLITRLSTASNKKLYGQVRGEAGGFGVGSDFAWQAQAIAGYRFSKLFDMSIGYRAIGLDYKDESGNTTFVYDVVTYGAMIRFGFNF